MIALPRTMQELEEENRKLCTALAQVKNGSLLLVRRAAFAPEIGVRYTEKIRLDIAAQCALLEEFIDETLAGK